MRILLDLAAVALGALLSLFLGLAGLIVLFVGVMEPSGSMKLLGGVMIVLAFFGYIYFDMMGNGKK